MPVVTPFGDLALDDDQALELWTTAHARRHTLYVNEHLGPPGGSLYAPIDGDWMLRHLSRHVALAALASDQLDRGDVNGLALHDIWQTEEELSDWHALHNRLHFFIDHLVGVAGNTKDLGWKPPPNPPIPPPPPRPPPHGGGGGGGLPP